MMLHDLIIDEMVVSKLSTWFPALERHSTNHYRNLIVAQMIYF